MTTIRVQALQWTVGVLCALIGMLALVTPHQFSAVTYAILQPNLELWGAAFVLVGAGLIGMATIGGSRRAEVLLHVSAALVLGLLALGFARTPSWLGLVNYGLLALGAGLTPLIRRQHTRSEYELLPLVIGASLLLDGLLMLLAQLRIAAPAFDSARPTWPFEAGLFLLGGSALIVHQLVRWPNARWFRLAQAPAIAALLAHLVTSGALSAHVWTGIAYYGGFALALGALPLVGRWLDRIDPRSLQVRLALALAASAAAPLLLAAAFDGPRDQQIVLFGDAWGIQDVMFLALVLGIAIAAAAGALVAARLTAPLKRLAASAEQFDQNQFSVPLPAQASGVTEIARLADAFATMQTRLVNQIAARERAHAEVNRLNSELEQRVADRTAELHVAIENLHAQMSQRATVEAALRESEARYRLLVELSPEPIVVHANGQYLYVNPAAARLYGADSPDDLVGAAAIERIHPDWRAAIAERTALLESGAVPTHALGLRILRLDGSTLDVETTAAAVNFDGQPAMQVIVRDVSERKAMERIKDEFISIVSHELRTPLTSIRGSLGLLGGGMLGPLSDSGQRMVDIAVANADRLIRLLTDILDLERISTGRINLTRAPHCATDLVDQAVAEMRGLAERSAVRLVLGDVGGLVDADADRVVQVLANLLSNAIKFSDPGQRVWVSATATGEVVRFSVLDEGRGIPADKLDMIFERFSQVDASDSREKGGTGLGLPICRSIVESHGGRIWAERPAGGGSRFVFDLPRAELAAQAA